jgi:mannitol operon transcriptional antiterminator
MLMNEKRIRINNHIVHTIMTFLTTRQRDLLQLLLDADGPLGSAELAAEMQLTPRQVNYGLKGLKRWLAHRNVALNATPGVGVALTCTPEQYGRLTNELASESNVQLILTSEQRQQLLALILLTAQEPLILYQLQQLAQASRTTVLKDLDAVADWLTEHDVLLERRPNYGVQIKSQEQERRQALAAWLWGETTLGQPLTQMTHTDGLVFSLGDDADLLPIVQRASEILKGWDAKRALWQVAYAEAQLDGRFTDDAVLHLALVFAIQTQRVQSGHLIQVEASSLDWLKTLAVWPVAAQITKRLAWSHTITWPEAEIATIAMQILATPRNDRWPGDLDVDNSFADLIDALINLTSQSYKLPGLQEDVTLRDGIITHVIPACLRHRFQVWLPSSQHGTALSQDYIDEHKLANELASIVQQHTQVTLAANEINNIALLLRAAFIRERPNRSQEVIVVCPSGMATAQLLTARLRARFPRLGNLRVVSVRELNDKIGNAELIITTVPLPTSVKSNIKIIQVHPLLLPEDIETITRWLF